MYRAKDSGKNTFCFYTADMNQQAARRMEMESHLRHAIELNELTLHYQPQVSIMDGAIVGAEALLRWDNPRFGSVSPAEFIPLAEDSGLIVSIGNWVIEQVCRDASEWRTRGHQIPRIAINISSRQIRRPDFVATLGDTLRAHDLPPASIELEITESLLLEGDVEQSRILETLNAAGINLSLDDFGTGYSSLSYLKRFPFNQIKIDRAFVRESTTDPGDAALCKAIIAMARGLNLTVVGEGVETEAQLRFLREQGAHIAQGYLFSRPLPAGDFVRLFIKSAHQRPRAAPDVP
jgi:EAL domain-containing protein (putative c-di-GMP-specific phosphodiesterase class I)